MPHGWDRDAYCRNGVRCFRARFSLRYYALWELLQRSLRLVPMSMAGAVWEVDDVKLQRRLQQVPRVHHEQIEELVEVMLEEFQSCLKAAEGKEVMAFDEDDAQAVLNAHR